MTVSASEALLALAGELAPRLAPAAAVRSTHVGGNVALASWCAVGCHGDGAAVNHCRGERQTVGATSSGAGQNKRTVDNIKGLAPQV